ncbi:MAG: VanW family protein [Micropepsaceae bacterium]
MSALRSLVRSLLPQPLRQSVAQIRRSVRDHPHRADFATERMPPGQRVGWHEICRVMQTIQPTAHFEGKMNNLHLAAQRLDGLEVQNGKVASFWKLVGKPSEHNGFRTGRGIVNDQLQSDVGGGLCQIASLMYELGLRSGCEISERFCHTRDLYTEASRFTPLGLDATVVWGFKDVRVRNTTGQTLSFCFEIVDHTIIGVTLAPKTFPSCDLAIQRWDLNGIRHAEVTRHQGQSSSVVSTDSYVIDPT